MVPCRWQMPGVHGAISSASRYPLGMSLDSASVDPLSNALLFYVPTINSAGQTQVMLYFVPLEDPVDLAEGQASSSDDGERDDVQPIWIEDSMLSAYAGNVPYIFSYVSSGSDMPRLVFTLYAGLFGRRDSTSGMNDAPCSYAVKTCHLGWRALLRCNKSNHAVQTRPPKCDVTCRCFLRAGPLCKMP
jgi:hypothetical protein